MYYFWLAREEQGTPSCPPDTHGRRILVTIALMGQCNKLDVVGPDSLQILNDMAKVLPAGHMRPSNLIFAHWTFLLLGKANHKTQLRQI